jgi:hypothetical protein
MIRTASITTGAASARAILRHSRWDALLIALAMAQGLWLLAAPTLPVIALGLWWNANTISHNFIHRPFFRSRTFNRGFSLYLSALLGLPQTLWRDRHLAHHAGRVWRLRFQGQILGEVLLVAGLWAVMLALAPKFWLTVYLPGYTLGLGLCYLHGYYEHARGTVSHYGAIYNTLFFNDGYHAEHHADPSRHWRRLPERREAGAQASRWPAVLRWLDALTLEALERIVLRAPLLQRFVLRAHERAFRRLLPRLGAIKRVGIVGGGLFPRTALILRRLLPEAQLVIIDAQRESIAIARAMLHGQEKEGRGQEVSFPLIEFVHEWYDPARHGGFDLVVIPLAFVGARASIYRQPSAPAVLLHDWFWHRRGRSVIVSVLLLKRLNLVHGQQTHNES